ncbi:type IVB secretion system protein IcmH/DotU [Candidatus Thiosymbion oneisti]|uniref:type IVB secretion system protein IcmH/DotU n=1 Tax=Candidatus Thiosymbion oneisti TaxID=589554 RepID=UPI000AED4E17|nr:type IVB secretion system protein IcmH/DotU [Candidatus Thiosymbion oneisti]
MSQDDSFSTMGDSDRTLIRPTPGGHKATGAPPLPPRARAEVTPIPRGALPTGTDLNPLVRCASPLLAAAGQLRNSTTHPDPEGLRNRLVSEVRTFEECARAKSIPENNVLTARYVLCSLLDEAVLGTPWGSESIWAEQGLLIGFHKETWGGEKFFLALERLMTRPSVNLDLLELMYLCLAFGFRGRYARAGGGGRDQLETVREQLYQTIRAQRGDPERELSPHWRGIVEQRDPLIRILPLWVLSALAGVLLVALFAGFRYALHSDSDPVFLALGKLDVPTVEVPRTPSVATRYEPSPPVAERPLSLRILLADEIAAGQVEIVDGARGQTETVVIQSDQLFRSGQASLNKQFLALLEVIGGALQQLPGEVLVTGHTDSIPIRTLKFPSNQVLSARRAQNVTGRLRKITGQPDRFTAKGLADSRPRMPEDPTHARNRRVEISLRHPARVG